jgi:hypothetical protein
MWKILRHMKARRSTCKNQTLVPADNCLLSAFSGIRRGRSKWLGMLLGCCLLPSVAQNSPAASPSLECFATSDLVRVFEDGYGSLETGLTNIQLFGLRGETVSGQCVVVAHEDVETMKLSVGRLRQVEGTGSIPEQDVECNFIGGIFIKENSPNRTKTDLVRSAPAWFPDILTEERQCSMKKGTRKSAYTTIKIPPETPAGEYRGEITVTAGATSSSVPLALKVYPLTLPEARHVQVAVWVSTWEFQKHHGLDPGDHEGFSRLLKIYAENMAGHRQNVFRVGLDLIETRRNGDGKLDFDFSRFDSFAEVFWSTGLMDLLETGFVARFGTKGWSGSEIVLSDFLVKDAATGQRASIPGKEFLPQFLPAVVNHLRAKGWLKKTVFHICDEPSNHNVMAWRNASDFVYRFAPELRRIDAIETPYCLGALEVWVPKLDHLATWQDAFEEAQRQGNELWFYTVGIFQGGSLLNKTVDVPLIETRLMHWLNYRYDLRGYLHWGLNSWTDDPVNAPGQHRGDGWHVYPKKDGLLNSLRWEQMRNGLQDYECLWLLEEKIARIKATVDAPVAALINPRQRGVEIASQVVADYQNHTSDPEVLYRARRQVIEETLSVEHSPRVLLQTDPLEHSPVARGCAVDVHGWAEPGTTIKINGEAVPVATNGLFLEQLPLSSDRKIVLEAQGKNGKKTLVREFKDGLESRL